ncbi:hypothetical protein Ami103574_12400 [Aminipila butyrica]|uniref:Uncharacterized protein n=1 Tax=Aminipila butyrica TaxID=433296 RepID=A0A858BY66_9FIRM|nr:hypothetical protein [Aminipila butyrica]QIB70048.1 hypothetical protein Ami103574_12400 [Aminipila butyrica]
MKFNIKFCYYILKACSYGFMTSTWIGEEMCFFFSRQVVSRAESATVRVLPGQRSMKGTVNSDGKEVGISGARSQNCTHKYLKYNARLGDWYGIEKFVINQHGYVGIY